MEEEARFADSTLARFHLFFDATVSFKVQPTEMTDLRGSRHAPRSCSLSAATLNIRERRCSRRK